MKRIGGIFYRIADMDNLRLAAKMACRSRKDRGEVTAFKKDAEGKLSALRESILDGSYVSSNYRMFVTNENGKDRLVADLPLYPDRILHWAICLVAEGPLNRKLIGQTYASIPGTGHHAAMLKVYSYIRKDPRVKYALSVDVSKFFASVDKGIMKSKLREVYKDCQFLRLMDGLIDDYELPGLPIGNRTSPMLANLYLSEIDHAMKERYHCHYYVRYMDDIVILGYSTKWLHRMKRILEGMLTDIGLEIKCNWQVYPIDSRGIPFLGYRIFSDHILLKKRTKRRMQRAAKRIAERLEDPDHVMDRHDLGTVHSYEGVLKWCNGKNLRKVTFDPLYRADERNQCVPKEMIS